MPTTTRQEHKDKHKKKGSYSHMPGKGEASQGQVLRWRALLGEVPVRGGVQNGLTGDSMARLSSSCWFVMGMVTGAAHRQKLAEEIFYGTTQANSKRTRYPPLLYQAAHVHKLIPLQNPTAQTLNGCIWPIHSVLDLPQDTELALNYKVSSKTQENIYFPKLIDNPSRKDTKTG